MLQWDGNDWRDDGKPFPAYEPYFDSPATNRFEDTDIDELMWDWDAISPSEQRRVADILVAQFKAARDHSGPYSK